MSDEPSIRFTEEKMIRAAKLVAALFGLLLVVVLPLGAFVSERGIMTSNPKSTYQQMPSRLAEPSAPTFGTGSGDASVLMKNQASPPSGTMPNQNVPPRTIKTSPVVTDVNDLSALVLGVSQSVRDYATNCRRNSGIIRSGSGGERLCSASNYTLSWPMVSVCGMAPTDTKWTVFRGDTDTWDITITCSERPECDGPSNALCTKNGCVFSDACLPKEYVIGEYIDVVAKVREFIQDSGGGEVVHEELIMSLDPAYVRGDVSMIRMVPGSCTGSTFQLEENVRVTGIIRNVVPDIGLILSCDDPSTSVSLLGY